MTRKVKAVKKSIACFPRYVWGEPVTYVEKFDELNHYVKPAYDWKFAPETFDKPAHR